MELHSSDCLRRAKHFLVMRLESTTKAALHDNRSQEYNGNAGIVFLRSEFPGS
jgi:hypothetical protein